MEIKLANKNLAYKTLTVNRVGNAGNQDNSVSVGEKSPCLLSFVYTSYIRCGVHTAPKFGKHA